MKSIDVKDMNDVIFIFIILKNIEMIILEKNT